MGLFVQPDIVNIPTINTYEFVDWIVDTFATNFGVKSDFAK